MKLVMGILTLVFVGLAMSDLSQLVMHFSNGAASAYWLGIIIKLGLAFLTGAFAFQKKADGV